MLIETCNGMSDGDQSITKEQIDRVVKNFKGAQGHMRADIGRKKRD